jgi:hypothetical protein
MLGRHRAKSDRSVSRRVLLRVWAVAFTAALACNIDPAIAAGAGLKAMWGPGTHDGVSLFPTYRELGTQLYQDKLAWNQIVRRRPRHPRNPNDPAYRWPAEVTRAVAEANKYGMQVALMLIFAPRWANGNKPPKWATFKRRDFDNFAVAASRRYPSVHLWMIWGEPSRSKNFRPLTPAFPYLKLRHNQLIAPHLYSKILDSAYGALKAANHANLIIGGMTDPSAGITPQQWIENMRLPDGKPPRLDMFGHNPFSVRVPDLSNPPSINQQFDFSDLRRLSEFVAKNLGRPDNPKPKLFLSEWTIPTAQDEEFNYHVEQRVQALWITDGLRIARELPSVYALGWIHLYDELPVQAGGLIKADGAKKLGYFAWEKG